MYYYAGNDASYGYRRRQEFEVNRPQVHYSRWQIFAMVLVWLFFVGYIFSLMPAIHNRESIPYNPVLEQQWQQTRDSLINEANAKLDAGTLTPEFCAQTMYSLMALEDSLILMNRVPHRLLDSDNYLHIYFTNHKNRTELIDRYRSEINRLRGWEPEQPISFNLWGLLIVILVCNLAVILIKRFPLSSWKETKITFGDVTSLSLYALLPFIGAAKYREDNWIKKTTDKAAQEFVSRVEKIKYPRPIRPLIRFAAYVYAAIFVTNVIIITTVIVTVESIYFFFGSAEYDAELLVVFRRWYLNRSWSLNEIIMDLNRCNAINAPPMFYVLINQNVNPNIGERNENFLKHYIVNQSHGCYPACAG